MKIKFKKNITAGICIVILINIVTVYLLFKSRLFSHLAIWNVLESNKQEDFYWPPENAPAYFHFEQDSDKISGFREETISLAENTEDEFKTILLIVKYVMNISSNNLRGNLSLNWDSPAEILKQVQQGASANCFHRAILFSTYLSSLGVKSRLWTLENDNFNATAHSINEVYIRALKKWVFIDVTFGFYVSEDGIPLSFLEFRERLLMRLCFTPEVKYNLVNLNTSGVKSLLTENSLFVLYRRLIKCVFLRADNDFVNRYNHRYGILHFAKQFIDRFPDNIKRGLDYLLEKQKFIHYVDGLSESLQSEIILAKLSFYFLVFSSAAIGIFASGILCKILSHKHTCQR